MLRKGIILAMIIFVFIVASCQSNIDDKDEVNTDYNDNIMQMHLEPSQSITDDKEDAVTDYNDNIMQRYLDVLQSKTNFRPGLDASWPNPQYFQSDYINLIDYLTNLGEGVTWEVTEFTVLDMTDNGINDIVLSLIHPQIMEDVYLILVYEDEVVNSIFFTKRNMFDIKIDGTYFCSVSGHWNVTRLLFTSGVFSSEEVSSSPNYYDFPDDFNQFVEEQDNKESAEWFPFSSETIAEDLPAAWHSNL